MFGHTSLVLVREAKHPAAVSHPLQVIDDVHHVDDAQVTEDQTGCAANDDAHVEKN
jgi:hypothetical protein